MTSMVLAEKQGVVSSGFTWTDEKMALAKKMVCPPNTSDAEFQLFMAQCERSGMNPFIGQCFCVPRGGKNIFQAAESGMLSRAEDFPDYEGTTSGSVYAKDTFKIDSGSGTVEHIFNPAGDRGVLVGAWARVVRSGRVPVVKWLLLKDYDQSQGLWKKLPATMIQKCAKVAALRDAFPKVFGGIYTKDEVPEDVVPTSPPPTKQVLREIAGPEAVTEHEGEVVAASINQAATAAAESQKPSAAELLRKCTALIDDAESKGDLTALASVGAKISTRFKDSPDELATARLHYAAAESRMMVKTEAA